MDEREDGRDNSPITFGIVLGGATAANRGWDRIIWDLRDHLKMAEVGMEAPLQINVVFHVPGNILQPEFEGVRTGTYSRKRGLLMVQVALPEEPPADAPRYLAGAVNDALEEGGRWAERRHVEIDLPGLTGLLDRALAVMDGLESSDLREEHVAPVQSGSQAPDPEIIPGSRWALVLQWSIASTDDYDTVVAIEDLLNESLADAGEVDGHDVGSDEMNILIWTHDPIATFAQAVAIASTHPQWERVRAGYREESSGDYTPLWPADLSTFEA